MKYTQTPQRLDLRGLCIIMVIVQKLDQSKITQKSELFMHQGHE